MAVLRSAVILSFLHTCIGFKMPTAYTGFNSGNTLTNWKAKMEHDFLEEFTAMQNLPNAPGPFNTVRLYTNIQGHTDTDILSAIPAALKTNTSMFLGLWCSGTNNITNELTALKKAIDLYGQDFADAVIAISVGSEDLYRRSKIGIKHHAGPGNGPKEIVEFIKETRKVIEGTPLCDKPVGHVDSWLAWGNKSNSIVVDNSDFIGVNIYPYFENDTTIGPHFYVNTYDNAVKIFEDRYEKTVAAAKGKEVWLAETGWPFNSTGSKWGQAVASPENQRNYWRDIGCSKAFGKINTWWYNLREDNPMSMEHFAITNSTDTAVGAVKFDLTCPAARSSV